MAALAASDVTYSIAKRKLLEDGRDIVQASLAFGDGSKTYPSGGVPVTIAKLGCPVVIDSLEVSDLGASGYVFSYDRANKTIRMFQSRGQASTPFSANSLIELTGSAAPASLTIKVTAIGY